MSGRGDRPEVIRVRERLAKQCHVRVRAFGEGHVDTERSVIDPHPRVRTRPACLDCLLQGDSRVLDLETPDRFLSGDLFGEHPGLDVALGKFFLLIRALFRRDAVASGFNAESPRGRAGRGLGAATHHPHQQEKAPNDYQGVTVHPTSQ